MPDGDFRGISFRNPATEGEGINIPDLWGWWPLGETLKDPDASGIAYDISGNNYDMDWRYDGSGETYYSGARRGFSNTSWAETLYGQDKNDRGEWEEGKVYRGNHHDVRDIVHHKLVPTDPGGGGLSFGGDGRYSNYWYCIRSHVSSPINAPGTAGGTNGWRGTWVPLEPGSTKLPGVTDRSIGQFGRGHFTRRFFMTGEQFLDGSRMGDRSSVLHPIDPKDLGKFTVGIWFLIDTNSITQPPEGSPDERDFFQHNTVSARPLVCAGGFDTGLQNGNGYRLWIKPLGGYGLGPNGSYQVVSQRMCPQAAPQHGSTIYGPTMLGSGWHHVVATYDGFYHRMYLDGGEVGRVYDTGVGGFFGSSYLEEYHSDAKFHVGAGDFNLNLSGTVCYFRGLLDELFIYNDVMDGPRSIGGSVGF
jgi:hypothetical protein